MLPSGDSQMQGGNNGERQEYPRTQDKPKEVLQVGNTTDVRKADGQRQTVFYDQKEYEHRLRVVMKAKVLEATTKGAIGMLNEQLSRLRELPLDTMRNNGNKLVNQDMDIAPLEEMNLFTEDSLYDVAKKIFGSDLMKHYVDGMTKADREKWELSETGKAMVKGADMACKYIEDKADGHLTRIASRMEWFPVTYHIIDKVALVVFPVLGYFTGKYHLTDTMVFLWLVAAMPVLGMTAIWAVNCLWGWVERKMKKTPR